MMAYLCSLWKTRFCKQDRRSTVKLLADQVVAAVDQTFATSELQKKMLGVSALVQLLAEQDILLDPEDVEMAWQEALQRYRRGRRLRIGSEGP